MEILITILIGAVAGWLAGMIFKGKGFGVIVNIIVGIAGGFLGFWLFGKLGISLGTGFIGSILTSAIGAIIILFLLNLIFEK